MTFRFPIAILLLTALAVCTGCQQGAFGPPKGQAGATNVFQQQSQALTSQVQDLNRRVGQLDLNNTDLHRQLAQSEQLRQKSEEQVKLLQSQLGDVTKRLSETQVAKT